jgi:hypothetical protein
VSKLVDKTTAKKYDTQTNEILTHIHQQKHLCYHCLMNISTFEKLEALIINQELKEESEKAFDKLKFVFNCLTIYDMIVVFVIFGGPKLINFVTLFSSILICTSTFISNNYVVYFEYSVLITSVLIMIKCIYILVIDMIESEVKRRTKQKKMTNFNNCNLVFLSDKKFRRSNKRRFFIL